MPDNIHPAATQHLPAFITAPGETDVLFNVMVVFVIALVLIVGNLYMHLHALPERMAHRTSKVQLQIVAVLALIALFTHNHLYWIAALLLALVPLPDFSTPMDSIAQSLEKLANRDGRRDETPEAGPGADPAARPADPAAKPADPAVKGPDPAAEYLEARA